MPILRPGDGSAFHERPIQVWPGAVDGAAGEARTELRPLAQAAQGEVRSLPHRQTRPSGSPRSGASMLLGIEPPGPVTAALASASVGRRALDGAPLSCASLVESAVLEAWTPTTPMGLASRAFLVGLLDAAYGHDGVLGPRGPLGPFGPIGRHPWNPSTWMKAAGPWRALSSAFTAAGGPLGALGPLGPFGPLSSFATGALLPSLHPLARELGPLGLFTAVGPHSVLGAVAVLGPLGPVGAHGRGQNDDGEFVDEKGVVRTEVLRSLGPRRSHGLFELYREDFAAGLCDNDASFMVRGSIAGDPDGDEFSFTPPRAQLLTITVVPETPRETFVLELSEADGRLIARSDSRRWINWIQLVSTSPHPLRVRVLRDPRASQGAPWNVLDGLLSSLRLASSWSASVLEAMGVELDDPDGPGAYRLFVAGAKGIQDED